MRLLWIDLEMTGLDPELDFIIECASVITDENLEVIAEGDEIVIHVPQSHFAKMDAWNRKHHKTSGLWRRVQESKTSLEEAEQQMIDFAEKHLGSENIILAGNSIWQDRRFLHKHMPRFEKMLHYRMVDVSSLKILTKAWYQEPPYKKEGKHRALDDIRESIEELAYIRKTFLR